MKKEQQRNLQDYLDSYGELIRWHDRLFTLSISRDKEESNDIDNQINSCEGVINTTTNILIKRISDAFDKKQITLSVNSIISENNKSYWIFQKYIKGFPEIKMRFA